MSPRTPSVAIIAGEPSGDVYGARLAERLKDTAGDIVLRGIGGARMRSAGVSLIADSSSWSAIGVAEALKLVPRLLAEFAGLRKRLASDPPDVLVLIDFGAFNVRLAKALRHLPTRILYYVPPGSWKRGATYDRLSGLTDRVVTPFRWSAEALRGKGFTADWFGHPLLDVLQDVAPLENFCACCGLDPAQRIIGLLPGSRKQELEHNLPALAVTAARLAQTDPGLQFAVPMASSLDLHSVADSLRLIPWLRIMTAADEAPRQGVSIRSDTSASLARRVQSLVDTEGFAAASSPVKVFVLQGMAAEVLAHSRASVVVSGTATLEAAVLGCPMVIIYRGSRLSAWEYRLLGRGIKYIGLPNIILDRMACPELIQQDAMPGRISEAMAGIIEDGPVRERMLSELAEVRSALGEPGATERTAQVVMELVRESTDD